MLKFATAQILHAEMAPASGVMQRTAHRAVFEYEARPGYLYVHGRAISSRTNENHDTFLAEEIKKAYKTFIGKPVFVNHENADHRRARGVIIDAALHEDHLPDGTPDTWVELLHEIDAIRFPKLAKAIINKEIDRTSMGCDVDESTCSACGNRATRPDEYCDHIPGKKGLRFQKRSANGKTTNVLIHEICRGLRFFENSFLVEAPADPTAAVTGVDTSGLRGHHVTASAPDTERFVTCEQGHRHFGGEGAAGVLAVYQHPDGNPRYHLAQRGEDVHHPGTWSIPGGALKDGEDPEPGAMREAREELGGLPDDLTVSHVHTDDHGGWAYHTVIARSPRMFKAHSGGDGETADTGWFTGPEVDQLDLHPGFADSWRAVSAHAKHASRTVAPNAWWDAYATGAPLRNTEAMASDDPDYTHGKHRAPGAEGAPLHNPARDGHYPEFPADAPPDQELSETLDKAHGNPRARVHIYRAVPPGVTTINKGDWVTPSFEYAKAHTEVHAMGSGRPGHVLRATVDARHVHTDGNDLREWSYHGPDAKTVVHWKPPQLAYHPDYAGGAANLSPEDHDFVHDPSRPVAERAHRLMSAVPRYNMDKGPYAAAAMHQNKGSFTGSKSDAHIDAQDQADQLGSGQRPTTLFMLHSPPRSQGITGVSFAQHTPPETSASAYTHHTWGPEQVDEETGMRRQALRRVESMEGGGDYKMMHKAPGEEGGAPMHELTRNGTFPDDVYHRPDWYTGMDNEELRHHLSRAAGHPDAEINMYRAVPKGVTTINKGDWVTPTAEYAHQHAYNLESEGTPGGRHGHVIHTTVPAKHLICDNDLQEYAYHGPTLRGLDRHREGDDWERHDDEDPGEEETPDHMGFGIHLSPKDHAFVHNPEHPVHERARRLLHASFPDPDDLAAPMGRSHEDFDDADDDASEEAHGLPQHPHPATRVVVHGRSRTNGVFGVSWAPHAVDEDGEPDMLLQRPSRRYPDIASYTHHDFGHRVSSLKKTAYGETKAPAQVDTLRSDSCLVCGNTEGWDGQSCPVCQFVKPPDLFGDPDTGVARTMDLRGDLAAQEALAQGADGVPGGPEDSTAPLPGQDPSEGQQQLAEDGTEPAGGAVEDPNDATADGDVRTLGDGAPQQDPAAPGTEGMDADVLTCPDCGYQTQAGAPVSTVMADPTAPASAGPVAGDVCPNCGKALLISQAEAEGAAAPPEVPAEDPEAMGAEPGAEEPPPPGEEPEQDPAAEPVEEEAEEEAEPEEKPKSPKVKRVAARPLL